MRAWEVLTAATGLAAAASGGAFLAWSTFTGSALQRLPAPEAIAMMQEANLTAPRSPVFMTLLFLPAATSTVLAVRSVVTRDPGAAWVVAGTAVYVVGVVLTTVVFHVPRNESLSGWDPAAPAGDWDAWLSAWLAGNHVRTVAGLVSAGLLTTSLR